MQKTSLPDYEKAVQINDIIKDKDAPNLPEDNSYQEKPKYGEGNLEPLRPRALSEISLRERTMSDPMEYLGRTEHNRCPECARPFRLRCKNRVKHTHFTNSRQIAQSIYPDFLSSLPKEQENPAELKMNIKKLLPENEQTKCSECIDATSKGPSKKSLIAWYRREYGLSFDEAKVKLA